MFQSDMAYVPVFTCNPTRCDIVEEFCERDRYVYVVCVFSVPIKTSLEKCREV